MKKLKLLVPLFLLFTFVFISCEEEPENDESREPSTVYLQRSIQGLFKINGQDIALIENSSTNNSAVDYFEVEDLPNGNVFSIDISMFVPTDETVSIIADVETATIELLNGSSVPVSYAGGSIGEAADFLGNGVIMQKFTFNFIYPVEAPPINASNLFGFNFQFSFEYKDNLTGDILNNKLFDSFIEVRGTGGGGGGSAQGDIIFWVNQDFGCGPISVTVTGVGNTTITGFYGSAPSCTDTGAGGNFDDLPTGNYSFSAACTNITWSGNFTISENQCLRFQLN